MTKKTRRDRSILPTATKRLWEAVQWEGTQADYLKDRPEESCHIIFPIELLDALRIAIKVGITCEELTALLIVMAGLREVKGMFDPDDLVERVRNLMELIKSDSDYGDRMADLERRVRVAEGMVKRRGGKIVTKPRETEEEYLEKKAKGGK